MDFAARPVLLCGTLFALCHLATSTASCDMIGTCKCDMSDGSGQINLQSLGVKNGSDSSFTMAGGDGWVYKYNPCYEFSYGFYNGLAVVQTTKSGNPVYDLGTQQSAYFNTTAEESVSIHYTALDEVRTSRVLLVCDAGVNTHTLQFVGELLVTEYDFMLETPCACPDLCNDDGIINPVGQKPPTNDGSVSINVHNPNQGKSAYMWMGVGGAMTSFVFHDFFLVFLIAVVVLILKYTGRITTDKKNNLPNGFGPGDVAGGPIPVPRNSRDGITNDSL